MTAPARECQPEADELRQHSPTPWRPCHHLQSAEKDASCKCGYRGGIWDGTESVLICEMGNCDQHEGHDMVSVGDRATQLANAAFIVEAVNNHDALRAALIGMVDMYVAMVGSGDCGFWGPETDKEVIAARRALAPSLERSGGAT